MENKKLINATFTCSNDIVEAGYRLTMMEWRVMEACIAQIDTNKELRVTDRFELSAKDFAKLYKISEESAYDELKEIAKQLFSRQVVINNPDPEHPEIKQTRTQWITSIDYLPTHGKLYLFFAPKIIPYISELKGKFTQCELKNMACLKTSYGTRLYLLLMQWKTKGNREIEIEWLKKQLELDDSYSAMCDFKKRVIDPAVNDVNKNSDYTVSWDQRKTGRKVTHLIFTFKEKKSPEGVETEKPKRTPKPKEKMVSGVPVSEIEKVARIGESYEDAAARINHEKSTKKTPVAATTAPVMPNLMPTQTPKKALSDEEYKKSSIEFIKAFIAKPETKTKLLAEFNEKGFATHKGITGDILRPELEAAGLFD